jgi:hypothetical protein
MNPDGTARVSPAPNISRFSAVLPIASHVILAKRKKRDSPLAARPNYQNELAHHLARTSFFGLFQSKNLVASFELACESLTTFKLYDLEGKNDYIALPGIDP